MDREKVISNLNVVHEYLRHFENTAKMGEWVADALALLKDYDTQLQYRDDHIAEYEKEIKRLEDLLKAREEIIKNYHKTDTFLAIHGWKWKGR